MILIQVATTPTVYGIETWLSLSPRDLRSLTLQQHLPFTVLKPTNS